MPDQNQPDEPQLNEHGFPDATPVADMAPEHQAAYWKHHARKHEARASAAPDAAELERLRQAEKELADRKAAELSDVERVQAEKAAAEAAATTAKAEAEAAIRKALLLEVAFDKGLTPAQAARLRGSTKEELEADADALKELFGTVVDRTEEGASGGASRSGGARGSDVGGRRSLSAGEERYRQRQDSN
ncbi:hypothetical protein AB0A77_02155 [Streptomyces varsoviensis]|uniref:hypothetical protein n=1 Tax=Streptomyces varsoviensis TaxID=67373 RepID=UPI0033FF599E